MRWLYNNLVAGFEELPSGCVLAHCMGLGKTLQAIAFMAAFQSLQPAAHVLVIVPPNGGSM